VAEDVAPGRRPLGRFKTIDRAAMIRQAVQLSTRLGVSTDPNRPPTSTRSTSEGTL
jgi:rhamnose transport system ATP-binding protein